MLRTVSTRPQTRVAGLVVVPCEGADCCCAHLPAEATDWEPRSTPRTASPIGVVVCVAVEPTPTRTFRWARAGSCATGASTPCTRLAVVTRDSCAGGSGGAESSGGDRADARAAEW